jgi:hypothetical protein
MKEFSKENIISVLEEIASDRKRPRIRIFYGDPKTGKSYNEEHDIFGYVSKLKTGSFILLYNNLSKGGTIISTDIVIRITKNKVDLIKHPKFHVKLKYDFEIEHSQFFLGNSNRFIKDKIEVKS